MEVCVLMLHPSTSHLRQVRRSQGLGPPGTLQLVASPIFNMAKMATRGPQTSQQEEKREGKEPGSCGGQSRRFRESLLLPPPWSEVGHPGVSDPESRPQGSHPAGVAGGLWGSCPHPLEQCQAGRRWLKGRMNGLQVHGLQVQKTRRDQRAGQRKHVRLRPSV